jgi:hypothetical protein
VTAAQLTRLAVLGSLVSSLSAALSMRTADSDPALMLSAAAKNAAGLISMALECAAEGLS